MYEVVWGMTLDPRNFSRKVVSTDGFIEATGGKRVRRPGGRPRCTATAGPTGCTRR